MISSDILGHVLAQFDQDAYIARVVPELVAGALENFGPEALRLSDEALADLLAGPLLRGRTDLIDDVTLALAVEGPELDPWLDALRVTVDAIRAALEAFDADEPQWDSIADGLALLRSCVESFDNLGTAPAPPTPD